MKPYKSKNILYILDKNINNLKFFYRYGLLALRESTIFSYLHILINKQDENAGSNKIKIILELFNGNKTTDRNLISEFFSVFYDEL
jgi:hypothetical protein